MIVGRTALTVACTFTRPPLPVGHEFPLETARYVYQGINPRHCGSNTLDGLRSDGARPGRRDVLFANEADLAARKLEHGDLVDVETALPSGSRLRLVSLTAVAYDITQ